MSENRNNDEKKGTGPICPKGPEGAPHKVDLSPSSHILRSGADVRKGWRRGRQ